MNELSNANGDGIPTVTIAEAREITEAVWEVNPFHAFFWYGGSGIGKTAMAEQMRKPDEDFFAVYAHSFNPTESNGILYVNEKTGLVEWAKLGCLPLPEERGDSEKGIICIEEVNQAPPSIQAELMKLIFARVSGNYKVPPGYRMLGLANRPKDKSNVNPIPYALRIRWSWLYIEPDLDCWMKDFAIPNDIDSSILAFLRFKPTSFCLDTPPPDGPGPSPRTWTMANDSLRAGLQNKLDLRSGKSELLRASIVGAVGPSAGAEYMEYRDVYEKLPPDMTAVALGDDPWLPPTGNMGLIYATIYSIAHIYKKRKDRMDRLKIATTVFKIGEHLGKEQFFPLLMDCWGTDKQPFRDAIDPSTNEPYFARWAQDMKDYVR